MLVVMDEGNCRVVTGEQKQVYERGGMLVDRLRGGKYRRVKQWGEEEIR